MQTSLSAARDKKSDFSARNGGNRYMVEKSIDELGNKQDSVNKVDGVNDQLPHDSSHQTEDGPNLDYLLARALQTTLAKLQAAR